MYSCPKSKYTMPSMYNTKISKPCNNPNTIIHHTSYKLLIFQSIVTTSTSHLLSPFEQDPGNRHQQYTDAAQQTRSSTNTETTIHLQREQRKDCSQRISHESIGSHGARAGARPVGIYQIIRCRNKNT